MTSALVNAALSLGQIGDRPGDSDDEKLKHTFLIYMGVLMSGGGVLWGTIAASFQLWLPAIVPYGYVVLTVINLGLLYATKNFGRARFVQVFISLLLPFLFQWSLGGFVASGGVMLWAMLAIVGSLTFSSARQSLGWLGLYSVLTVVSGLVDHIVREQYSANPSMDISVAFFVTNIVVISAIVFGLTIFLMVRREEANVALQEANHTITELNENLEGQVQDRTIELRGALIERQAVLDNLVDGLVATDPSGSIRLTNPALLRMLQTADDPVGKTIEAGLPAQLAQAIRDATSQGRVTSREVHLPNKRIGLIAASSIIDSDAVDHGVVALLRDVTLEKEVDRMKTDFIATVSHELRTPLTSVLGFAKITKSKLEDKILEHVPEDDRKASRAVTQVRGNLDIIVSEGERLTALINDVLDISKMEAGRMEWKMGDVAVQDLVHRATQSVRALFPEDGPVQLLTEVQDNLPVIQGDEHRLLQVIINLLSNAAKFTDEGKVIVSAFLTEQGIQVAVSDTGEGIDASEHAAIFEKFKQVGDTLTNKPQGTGLGLPICQQIVRAHQAEIIVQSAMGQGSVFSFTLPVLTDAPIPAPRPRSDRAVDNLLKTLHQHQLQHTDNQQREILVVDDDPSLRELLRQQLTEYGYSVRLASNGFEALGQVRARRPDLVILDVMMPEISGFDVAQMLKKDPDTEQIPILILSILHDKERGLELGVDHYLTKPATSGELLEAVAQLLGQESGARKVLLVDDSPTHRPDVIQALTQKGYEVVGQCTSAECIQSARAKEADLILVLHMTKERAELLHAIRNNQDLGQVYVIQLIDEVGP